MRVINARNTTEALMRGLELLKDKGVSVETRNGPAIKVDQPVATVTERPRERVLFFPWRDANPFFHLYESLWMLAGRRDVAPLARYVSRMSGYSDNGKTFNAAYGFRWRSARESVLGETEFNRDQLDVIITELIANPSSRQCVLQIWDHELDLGRVTKDHACNVAATFQIDHFGALDMVVFCRSNDAIWGCHGANAVHFSMLLEYVANAIHRPVGTMTQISVNYHAYESVFDKTYDGFRKSTLRGVTGFYAPTEARPSGIGHPWHVKNVDLYRSAEVEPFTMLMSIDRLFWDRDVQQFVTHDGKLPQLPRSEFFDPFFRDVAWPIVRAHDIWKDYGDADNAIMSLEECRASDWRRACIEWIVRRKESRDAR